MDIVKVFFPISSTLFSKRFILLKYGLKFLKNFEKFIIKSTIVLIVLYKFSKCMLCLYCKT